MDPSENRGVRPWNMDSYHPVPRASIDIASTGNSVSEGPTSYGLLKKEPRVSYSSRTSTTPGAPLARGSIASWGLELLSVGISLASITAIIVILHFENGKPLTTWKFALTLNTIIAVLGTLSRTTLAFALSSCVGQQKWNWLRRKTDHLAAFERFDEASRGPWGATRLFFWLRARHWAALGALVIMGTVAFDPFLQAVLSTSGQLSQISTAEVSSNVSTIAQALRVDAGIISSIISGAMRGMPTDAGILQITGSTSSRPDLGIISSINNGFHPASTYQNSFASADCTTGNCTWPIFSSAAICSSCNDVSKEIKVKTGFSRGALLVPRPGVIETPGNYTAFILPYVNITNYNTESSTKNRNKTSVTYDHSGNAYMTMNITIDPGQTVSFRQIKTLLIAFAVFRAPDDWVEGKVAWNKTQPIATECALYMCANAYQSRIQNGILEEKVVGSWAAKDTKSYRPDPASNVFANGPVAEAWVDRDPDRLYDAMIPRTDLQMLIPEDESKEFPESMARSFNVSYAFLRSTADGLINFASSQDNERKSVRDLVYFPSSNFAPAIEALWASKDITKTFEDVALSLTNQVRNTAPSRFEGTTQQWIVHMRIRWEYITFPAAMLAIGIIYVILTIVESMRLRMPVWKDQALPALLHGFNDETQHLLRETHASSKKGASATIVKFAHDEQTGCVRLVAG